MSCIAASDTDAPRLWIAFELIDGVPLSRLLSADIELSRQIEWLKQILAGLQHLHDCGGVHRDVKPANVMVEIQANGAEQAVVVDLGLTSFHDLEEVVSSEEGTPAYLAPELVVSGTGSLCTIGCLRCRGHFIWSWNQDYRLTVLTVLQSLSST